MLDAVMRYLPSPLDVEAIEGTNPNTGMRILASLRLKNLLQRLLLRLLQIHLWVVYVS